MFAVVETGGKQYKVSPGQTVEVEKLPAEPGDTVELGRVLLISTDDETFIGSPLVEDAKVVARVAQLKRGPKLIIFRYKSKSRYRRKTGHRQDYTELTIQDIWANGASLLPAKEEAEVEPEVDTETEAEETTAAKSSAAKEKETAAAGKASSRKGKAAKVSAASAETAAEDTEESAEETETRTVVTEKRVTTRRKVVVETDESGSRVVETGPEEVTVEEEKREEKPPRRSRKGE